MLNVLLAAFDNLKPMNKEALIPALNFLWQGLLAIFVVIGAIIIAVKLTQLAIDGAEKAKKNKQMATNPKPTVCEPKPIAKAFCVRAIPVAVPSKAPVVKITKAVIFKTMNVSKKTPNMAAKPC